MKMKFKKNKSKHSQKRSSNADDFDQQDEDDYDQKPKWYEEDFHEPQDIKSVSEQILIELKDEAKQCLGAEVNHYNTKNSKSNSNFQWMKTIMHKGTVSDKVAAHIVAIQDNPLCQLNTLNNLIGMVKVGKKKECFIVIKLLTELFLSDLLIPTRKLKPFYMKPLFALNDLTSGNAMKRRKILSHWYFEDQLKEMYTAFVLAINRVATQDTLEANKEKAITAMYMLLQGNAEQEKNLLAYIVNKLGDPSQKVASKAIYCLTQLLYKHPNMQEVVLKEIEKLLFRPNIGTKAQYYCLCFLSQFYLSDEQSNIARKMIEVYLAFFQACVKKGDVDSRMMSALLMGINRAYPYSKMEFEDMTDHINTLYRLVHLSSFNISLQVLTLLHHVTSVKMADRFYSAVYRKMADPKLLTTTYQTMFLSLIYKSINKDTEINRVKMFIKRLLQVALAAQPAFACGILCLVSKLLSDKSELRAAEFKPSIIKKMTDDNDDEEEEDKYYDIKDEKEENDETEENEEIEQNITSTSEADNNESIQIKDENDEDSKPVIFQGSSWYHKSTTSEKKFTPKPIIKYDPFARNPLYGGGQFVVYDELLYLVNNYHPTVALFARQILNNEAITYSGDPLKDFTLIRFLDRFVFKNPKKLPANTGAHPTFGKRKLYKPKGMKMLPVTSKGYLKESADKIPVDEQFLHVYLRQRFKHKLIDKDQDEEDNEEDNSDMESVKSEEFDEMLDKMMAGMNAKGPVDEDFEDIDYMGDITENLKVQKSKKGKRKLEDDEDEDEEMREYNGENDEDDELQEYEDEVDDLQDDDFADSQDGSDEDNEGPLKPDDEDLELMEGLSDDEEDMVFLSDPDEDESSKKKKHKKVKDDISSLFASADEFASMLEDEGASKQKPGSSNVMQNKDNASHKQLMWEENRNRWIKGFNRATKKHRGSRYANKRKLNRNDNKSNKKKKFKKS